MADKEGPADRKIESGLDWLSATCASELSICAEVYDAAMRFLEGQQREGNTAKEARLLGYTGVICGRCFIGDNPQGVFVRSTSSISTAYYEHIYVPQMHVSRLDLQVTIWPSESLYHLGKQARDDAAIYRKLHPKEGKRKITTIDDEDGGYTLYIGSKSSEHFCRLYNKGAESGETFYEGAWRYEIELHNDAATQVARYLATNMDRLEPMIAATVRQYFRSRGVRCPWNASDELSALQPAARIETDNARTLRWLAAQVRPSVQRLVSAGLSISVLEALGLPED